MCLLLGETDNKDVWTQPTDGTVPQERQSKLRSRLVPDTVLHFAGLVVGGSSGSCEQRRENFSRQQDGIVERHSNLQHQRLHRHTWRHSRSLPLPTCRRRSPGCINPNLDLCGSKHAAINDIDPDVSASTATTHPLVAEALTATNRPGVDLLRSKFSMRRRWPGDGSKRWSGICTLTQRLGPDHAPSRQFIRLIMSQRPEVTLDRADTLTIKRD